jgi:hypothetical protein
MTRMKTFVDRHASKIRGTLSCFDRVVITGTLPDICHAEAMARHLRVKGIRLFDYPQFAQPFREEIRAHAERLAQENGLVIEFIRRNNFRKEERIKTIIAKRGDHPGLVHIFSAMEPCPSFKPWHDKVSGKTTLKATEAKCLHYYFYFIHPELGLCYLRVPTWAPFRLQFYFNGHNELAIKLKNEGVAYTQLENAFVDIDDFPRAQALADALDISRLHRHLDRIALEYCPVTPCFASGYHWSLMQVEYATDVVFRRQADFQPLYSAVTHTAIHAIKPEHIVTFLGRKLFTTYQGEIGNDFHTRIEGTCIKHHMGPVAIKLYDKFGLIGRVECTSNDVTFFKHHRVVEHRDGSTAFKLAPMRKSIYSLPILHQLLRAATHRYLDFLAAIDDPSTGLRSLERISTPVRHGDRSYRGFNLFHSADLDLFQTITRGEFAISGFQARTIRACLHGVSSPQVSRLLKRLRTHGLIKKIGHRYKYYLTNLGRTVAVAGLKLRELVVIPTLTQLMPA